MENENQEPKTLADEISTKYISLRKPVEPILGAPRVICSTPLLHPSHLSITSRGIFDLGDLSRQDVEEIVSFCEELDLANNCFTLDMVPDILKAFPRLKLLNLSNNPLGSYSESLKSSYTNKSLGTLVLNKCSLSWDGLLHLLNICTELQELHLDFTDLDFRNAASQTFPKIRNLHFAKNRLSEESLVGLHTAFPNIEELYCHETDSKGAWSGKNAEILPKMAKLSLIENGIHDWEEIDGLNIFKSLKHLKITNCPVFKGLSSELRRQLIIARLPRLATLNGGEVISEKERDKAERAFLRYYMEKEDKPARYYELEKVHGRLDKLVEVSLKPKKEVSVLVKAESNTVLHTVNVYCTVSELKRKLEPVIGLSAKQMRMYYVNKGSAFGPDELKIGTKQLYTLNVADGDEFIVDKKE